MKILLYYETTTFSECVNETNSLQLIEAYLWNMCGKSLSNNHDVEIKFLLSEAAYFQNSVIKLLNPENIIKISDVEIFEIFSEVLAFAEIKLKIIISILNHLKLNSLKKYFL